MVEVKNRLELARAVLKKEDVILVKDPAFIKTLVEKCGIQPPPPPPSPDSPSEYKTLWNNYCCYFRMPTPEEIEKLAKYLMAVANLLGAIGLIIFNFRFIINALKGDYKVDPKDGYNYAKMVFEILKFVRNE